MAFEQLLDRAKGGAYDALVGAKSGAENTLRQRALAFAQLLMEASGNEDTPTYQDTQELAKQYRQNMQKSGVSGVVGGMVVDPLTWATMPLAAGKGLAGAVQVGGVSGLAGGGLTPVEQGDSRLANTYTGGAVGSALGAGLYGAGKVATSPTVKKLLADEFGGVGGDLPMDFASRMARAKEMGFNLDEPVYHGTSEEAYKNIMKSGFNPKKSTDGSIWFTTNKENIEKGVVGAAKKGMIIDAFLKDGKFASRREYDNFTRDELIARGYIGVKLPSEKYNEITYQIFDPKNIRSIHAAFDPEKVSSSKLLAMRVPLTAGLGGAAAYNATQDEGF